MDTTSKSKDGVNAAIEKHKDHSSIKTTNDHLDLVSVLKTICKPDIQNKVSNLNSKKARPCGNILRKCARIPQILMHIISLMIQYLTFVARTQTLQVLN